MLVLVCVRPCVCVCKQWIACLLIAVDRFLNVTHCLTSQTVIGIRDSSCGSMFLAIHILMYTSIYLTWSRTLPLPSPLRPPLRLLTMRLCGQIQGTDPE